MLRALQPLELDNEAELEAELIDMLYRARMPLARCSCNYLKWFFKL
jgi:hypothetical protein